MARREEEEEKLVCGRPELIRGQRFFFLSFWRIPSPLCAKTDKGHACPRVQAPSSIHHSELTVWVRVVVTAGHSRSLGPDTSTASHSDALCPGEAIG